MRSRSANLTARSHHTALRCNMRPGLIHRPGDGTLLRAAGVRTARTCNLLTLAGCGGSRLVGNETCTVSQHAMKNHSELAGERDLGLAHTGAGGQAHPPAL